MMPIVVASLAGGRLRARFMLSRSTSLSMRVMRGGNKCCCRLIFQPLELTLMTYKKIMNFLKFQGGLTSTNGCHNFSKFRTQFIENVEG